MKGMVCIGLDNPKFPENVGSAMRAVGVYGAQLLAIRGHRYKLRTDPMKHYRNIPMIFTDNLHDVIPYDCIPVAVDFVEGAIPLPEYTHPKRAFYVFGAEDATLGKRVISWCRDVVVIPTERCMNLAATVNVVLYDRMMKLYNNRLARDLKNARQF